MSYSYVLVIPEPGLSCDCLVFTDRKMLSRSLAVWVDGLISNMKQPPSVQDYIRSSSVYIYTTGGILFSLYVQSSPLNWNSLVPLTFGRIRRENDLSRVTRNIDCSLHGRA